LKNFSNIALAPFHNFYGLSSGQIWAGKQQKKKKTHYFKNAGLKLVRRDKVGHYILIKGSPSRRYDDLCTKHWYTQLHKINTVR
jgi:hypothetical protein